MKAIEIRLLSRAESYAYTARGQTGCAVTGCLDTHLYIAVGAQAGRVERSLLCGGHGAAWAALHHRPLPTAVSA